MPMSDFHGAASSSRSVRRALAMHEVLIAPPALAEADAE